MSPLPPDTLVQTTERRRGKEGPRSFMTWTGITQNVLETPRSGGRMVSPALEKNRPSPRRHIRIFPVVVSAGLIAAALSMSSPGVPLQVSASTVAPTWSLDNGPASLGFEDSGHRLVSRRRILRGFGVQPVRRRRARPIQREMEHRRVGRAPGRLQLNSVSCASETFCMADGNSQQPGSENCGRRHRTVERVQLVVAAQSRIGRTERRPFRHLLRVSHNVHRSGTRRLRERPRSVERDRVVLGHESDLRRSPSTVSPARRRRTVSPSAAEQTTRSCHVTLSGGTWNVEEAPNPGTDGFFYDVSCGSPTFCVAVGSVQPPSVGWGIPLTETWNGSVWTVIPSPNLPADASRPRRARWRDPHRGLLCLVERLRRSRIRRRRRQLEQGPRIPGARRWSRPGTGPTGPSPRRPAPVEPAGGGRVNLRGVSCVPANGNAECEAVGLQTPDNATITALVETTPTAVGALSPTSTVLEPNEAGGIDRHRYAVDHPIRRDHQQPSARCFAHAADLRLRRDRRRSEVLEQRSQAVQPRQASVTILDDGLPIAACPPQTLNGSDQAICSPPDNVGPFTAVYSGDSSFDGSSAATVTNQPPPTTTTTTPPPPTTTTTTQPPPTTTTQPLPTTTTTQPLPTTTTTQPPPTTTTTQPPTTTTTPATTTMPSADRPRPTTLRPLTTQRRNGRSSQRTKPLRIGWIDCPRRQGPPWSQRQTRTHRSRTDRRPRFDDRRSPGDDPRS